MSKTITTPALVLKRVNTGETDRVITLLTRDQGKVLCVAKGVRKMSSSKRAFLEPGNLITAYLIQRKSWPLLTQATLQNDFLHCKRSLVSLRQLTQVLEVADRLFTENNPEPELFESMVGILHELNTSQPHLGRVKHRITTLVSEFGFAPPDHIQKTSILELLAEITEKPMRSWDFLTVKS